MCFFFLCFIKAQKDSDLPCYWFIPQIHTELDPGLPGTQELEALFPKSQCLFQHEAGFQVEDLEFNTGTPRQDAGVLILVPNTELTLFPFFYILNFLRYF